MIFSQSLSLTVSLSFSLLTFLHSLCTLSLSSGLCRYEMNLITFLVGEFGLMASIPFVFSPNRALFSKAVANSPHQALLASLMSVFASIGTISHVNVALCLWRILCDPHLSLWFFASFEKVRFWVLFGWERQRVTWNRQKGLLLASCLLGWKCWH